MMAAIEKEIIVINYVKPTTKVTVTFGVMKLVTMTSNHPLSVSGHKLCQTDPKGHRDLWGLK